MDKNELDALRALAHALERHIADLEQSGRDQQPGGLTREQVSQMSVQEINARWEEIARWLAGAGRSRTP